jgi:fumarate hydratase class II
MTPPASGDGEYRIEHDTMGEVRVPVKALWRAQTQRAVENFPISGLLVMMRMVPDCELAP